MAPLPSEERRSIPWILQAAARGRSLFLFFYLVTEQYKYSSNRFNIIPYQLVHNVQWRCDADIICRSTLRLTE